MKSYVFKVVIEPDVQEDGTPVFSAYCPALKGCNTWGKDSHEALANIREAANLYIESLIAHGESVPVDGESGTLEIASPAVLVNV